MERTEAEALVRAQVAAWRAGDADAAAAAFADDGVFVSPGGVWRGPDGVRAAMRAFLAEATVVDVTVRRVVVDGDDGAVEWVWTERRGQTLVTMEDAIAFSVRDGRVTYWREYFDPGQTAPLDLP